MSSGFIFRFFEFVMIFLLSFVTFYKLYRLYYSEKYCSKANLRQRKSGEISSNVGRLKQNSILVTLKCLSSQSFLY